MDLLGQFLKHSKAFRGKNRLVWFWLAHRNKRACRIGSLPKNVPIWCDFSVPYEAMVWLEQEEQADLLILRSLLKPNDKFVDCGANIGIWSVVASAAMGSSGQVYAFEPNPATFKKLLSNTKLLQDTLPNHAEIKSFPVALGNASQQVRFQCEPEHNNSHVEKDATSSDAQTVTVNMDTLASVLGHVPVTGCKIDVEGLELEMLKGAESILREHHPWLCIEWNTLIAESTTLKDWEVHRYLRDLGYVGRKFEDALSQDPSTILNDEWQSSGYLNLFYSKEKR